MIDVILAAGYATRMYPLTENFPKPLLEIKGKTILDSLLEDVDGIPGVSSHVIVTNHKFFPIFQKWKDASHYSKPIRLIDDGSTTNDNRIGAVKDLLLALGECVPADEDFIVLAADNLLDFSLRGFAEFFRKKGTSVIMCHHEPSLAALRRTGVVVLDSQDKVLEMEEKPAEPKSSWAVPPFYIYSHADRCLIDSCIENGCGFDAPGNLARYLSSASVLHAWRMTGKRTDIGDLQTYLNIK